MSKKQEVYIGLNSQFSKTTGFSNTYIFQETKELTDEEIHDLIINKTTDADMIKQAIRKAQEKCTK